MVTDNSIANTIQTALNAQSTSVSASYQFRIFADMGDYEANNKSTLTNPQKQSATPYVDGVLMLLPSNITPLTTIKSYGLSQMLTILAPTTREQGEDGISGVLEVVKAWVENWAGQTGTLDDVAYVVAPQLPQVGVLSNDIGFWYVPISVLVTWQFVEGGVLGNQITISVNGTSALTIELGITRTRVTEMNSKDNNDDMTATVLQQGLTIKCSLPLVTESENATVAQQLFSDMLSGSLETSYSVTVNTPFGVSQTFQMVATEITSSSPIGSVVIMTATFVIASEIYSRTQSS